MLRCLFFFFLTGLLVYWLMDRYEVGMWRFTNGDLRKRFGPLKGGFRPLVLLYWDG